MFGRTPPLTQTRRGLLAGAVGLAALGRPELVFAAAEPLLAYERRLSQRLSDAGGGAFLTDFALALQAEANAFRTRLGRAQLAWDEGLAACARAHAADMADRRYFAHEAPEGFTHLDRVSLITRDLCGRSAENLAYRDFGPSASRPDQIEAMWEESPGHRKNLEHAAYSRVGYGVVRRGTALYAAGVYADASVRLARPLPFRLRSEADLASALAGSSPRIERLTVTAPFQNPGPSAPPAGAFPSLAPGLRQLRPLRAAGPGRWEVLSGPLFLVG